MKTIVITDPGELDAFKAYGQCGHYRPILKCGDSRRLFLWHADVCFACFAHGDSIGSLSGGRCQVVFVPAKPGFKEFLDGLIQKHRHDEEDAR